ncbi:MAG TPA: hypothetical protein VIC30_00885 [Orrella sp.]
MVREENQEGILGTNSGEEMTDRRQIADELWAAFKHWEGERKYALRQIVKHLRIVQADSRSNVAHLVAHHAP